MTQARPHETVEITADRGVAVIAYTSLPAGLITNKGAALLADALEAALADEGVRAVIITGGSGDTFIRHADVGQIARAALALEQGVADAQAFLDAPFQRLGQLLDGARKPVIAAINGHCMGGGFEIALACTVRVAGSNVGNIGLPEIRIDIFPGAGGTQRLARLIGRHKARLFILEGRVVNAATAFDLGLVDHLADDPVARAREIALNMVRRTPEAVAAVMDLTRFDDAAGLSAEALAFAEILTGPGVRERLEQFQNEAQKLEQLP